MADNSFPDYWMRLCKGEDDASREVFERYRDRLLQLATRQFDAWLRDRADPEGILQSAFRSFFCRARDGKLGDPGDWDHLWGLLTVITLRKCRNRLTYLFAQRRSAANELAIPADGSQESHRHEPLDDEPTPEEMVALREAVERLFRSFEEPERPVIELILQGYSVTEIVAHTGRAERTVRRLRERVRKDLERMNAEIP